MSTWTFPYDLVVHPGDSYMRRHFSRSEICQLYEHKQHLAQQLLQRHPYADRRVLEIGVRACYSAEAFCAAGATVYHGIDLDSPLWGGVPTWVVPAFQALQVRWPGLSLTLDVADSHAAAALNLARQHGPYALVHIDGDHSYQGTLADLEGYSPLALPSGVVVVDGVHWDETVWRATTAFARRNPAWMLRVLRTGPFGDDALLSKADIRSFGTLPSGASLHQRFEQRKRVLWHLAASLLRGHGKWSAKTFAVGHRGTEL